ncbi:MAG: uroporphyrinogen decarboxylase family protein [Phycisphaerae bacterium]
MGQTPREIVYLALKFQSPERLPRHTWVLPWAEKKYSSKIDELRQKYPDDIAMVPVPYLQSSRAQGDPYAEGISVDEWGCVFENIQAGIIGEVKDPIVTDIENLDVCQPPYEILPRDVAAAKSQVNDFCRQTDLFVLAGTTARPWERMQFLRGTQNAMMDVIASEDAAKNLLDKIHMYYLCELQFWADTEVDAIFFMDDWGSQNQLLISPKIWRKLFKPLYKAYCDLAHANGKFVFMHSDGCISEIYGDLIEIGVDAINSQLFVMDLAKLSRTARGKITFWGEIDRQHVMTAKEPMIARRAVRQIAEYLYDPLGGIIAQFELGPGVNIENAFAIYEEWDRVKEDKNTL